MAGLVDELFLHVAQVILSPVRRQRWAGGFDPALALESLQNAPDADGALREFFPDLPPSTSPSVAAAQPARYPTIPPGCPRRGIEVAIRS